MNAITVIEWNRLTTVLMAARSLLKRMDYLDTQPVTYDGDTALERETLREALQEAGPDLEALTGPEWRRAARPFQIG